MVLGTCTYVFSFILHRHARKYFTALEEHQLADVQRVMGLLAFSADTQIPAYKVCFFVNLLGTQ